MGDQRDAVLDKAVEFFKNEAGFHRLLNSFIKKYQGLGRIGGSVRLAKLSGNEKEAISRFLRRDLSNNTSITVKMADFELALQNTKFAGIGLKELLDGFAGYKILTRAEMQNRYETRKEQFFRSLMQRYTHPYCRQWLEHIQKKGSGTRGIHQAYDENSELLQKQLKDVLKALTCLPAHDTEKTSTRFQRLPVFASEVTGDPHGFDRDTARGRFLVWALQFIRRQQDENYPVSSSPSTEEINELLGHFGIIRDDLLNFVTCAGILAFDNSGALQKMWERGWRDGLVMNVPLRELVKLDKFVPAVSFANPGKEKVVFVVENSGVFSGIADCFAGNTLPPMVCTHGQAKLAALLLLDRLVANDTTVFYSGDFDPEGLQMAQRMARRYGERLKLWRYHTGDYESSMSKVTISPDRLRKLNGINVPGLEQVKEKIKSTRRAGYQEYLVHKLVEDIKKYIQG